MLQLIRAVLTNYGAQGKVIIMIGAIIQKKVWCLRGKAYKLQFEFENHIACLSQGKLMN